MTVLAWVMLTGLSVGADGVASAQHAQGPGGYADTIFDRLNEKNGLPGSAAQAFAQDSNGFLWIGTEAGVSRWDGYHFRSYAMHSGVAGTLPSNNVLTLYVDPQKRLWVGTNRGLALYDPALDSFQTFTPKGAGGVYPSIYQMVTDGARGLWLATRKGLDHFDPATGAFAHEPMEGVANGPNVQAVVRDADGRVWAGGTKGLFYSDATGHHFKAVTVIAGKPPTVWSLLRDREGRLWIGTVAGAYVLEAGAVLPRKIAETTSGTAPSPLDTQGVDTMIEAAPGVVWLGTYGEGIVEIDTHTWQTHRIVHQPSIPTSLSHDLVDALFRDRAGAVWVGSLGGLNRKNATEGAFLTFFGGTDDAAHPILDADVTAVMPTADGRLWIGMTEKGVEVFDYASGKRLDATGAKATAGPPLKMQLVSSFAPAPDGFMYFSAQQGVFRADMDGQHIVSVPVAMGSKAINQMVYDAGKLWIGATDGLWALPLHEPQPATTPALVPGPVNAVVRGLGNDVWAGTVTGLYRVDAVTEAVERSDISASRPGALPAVIRSMAMDREGRLWISTDGAGVYQLQGRDAKGLLNFRKITDADAGQIMEAPDGTIWFPAEHGIERLDPRTLAHESFTQADGLAVDNYWLNAGAFAPDGRLLLGGSGGLIIADPRAMKQPAAPGLVTVDEFSIGDTSDPGAQALANSGGGVVWIQPHANTLAVEFAALDYTAPELNKYAYRMLGVDRDWVFTDADHRVARYTNLSPGKYVLELRAADRNGVWGATRSVAIHVLPAWYQTVWMKLVALAVAIAWIFWMVHLYTEILRARQRKLERQVASRTAELQEATVQLQRSQMELERIAYSDSLTGLSNRRAFADCFQQLIARKQEQGGSFTLLHLDLDNFKSINDGYGHDVGDALLCEVAQRLATVVDENDCLARLGGDEFALLLENVVDAEGIDRICEKVVRSLSAPCHLQGFDFHTSASVGVAIYPYDGTEQESLFKSADVALYDVKREGRNGWRRHTRNSQLT